MFPDEGPLMNAIFALVVVRRKANAALSMSMASKVAMPWTIQVCLFA